MKYILYTVFIVLGVWAWAFISDSQKITPPRRNDFIQIELIRYDRPPLKVECDPNCKGK